MIMQVYSADITTCHLSLRPCWVPHVNTFLCCCLHWLRASWNSINMQLLAWTGRTVRMKCVWYVNTAEEKLELVFWWIWNPPNSLWLAPLTPSPISRDIFTFIKYFNHLYPCFLESYNNKWTLLSFFFTSHYSGLDRWHRVKATCQWLLWNSSLWVAKLGDVRKKTTAAALRKSLPLENHSSGTVNVQKPDITPDIADKTHILN